MIKSKILQVIVLVSFVSLIVLFLFYRSGKLDSYLPGSNSPADASINANTLIETETDTLPPKKDTLTPEMLPSSKSMMVVRSKPSKTKDTSGIKKIPDSLKLKSPPLFSGSKSGFIVDPSTFKFDTPLFKIDTSYRPVKKKKKDKQ
ncbi:MAG: hypothetical protein K2X48_02770 [Chitinophagaceae bacterium]|nr:hypothetical protein [Chitinophagaceae bacterium]